MFIGLLNNFSGEMSIKSFADFIIGLTFNLFVLNCKTYLYILHINPLSDL